MNTAQAKLFANGGSQAVRLPQAFRFPDSQLEVVVSRRGRAVVLEPLDEWPADFLACMKMLLEKGADVGAMNYSKVTPLHVAATHNFKDGVALLLEKGANPNAKDNVSATPLHWAAVTPQ